MKITVKIDDSYEQKLKAIQQRTHLNTTDVIKQAIDLMYEKAELSAKEKNWKLIEIFAGTAKGPEDLSITYKKYLDQDWEEKRGTK